MRAGSGAFSKYSESALLKYLQAKDGKTSRFPRRLE